MNIKDRITRSSLMQKGTSMNAKIHKTSMNKKSSLRRISIFVSVLLIFTTIASVLPATATSILAASTLTFTAAADARVEESHPSTNYGTSPDLNVVGASQPDIESYIRFTVSGVTGTVQNAKLRVFDGRD